MVDRRQQERIDCILDTIILDSHGLEHEAIIRNVSLYSMGLEVFDNLDYNIGDYIEVYIDDTTTVKLQVVRKVDTELRNWYYGLSAAAMDQEKVDKVVLLANN